MKARYVYKTSYENHIPYREIIDQAISFFVCFSQYKFIKIINLNKIKENK